MRLILETWRHIYIKTDSMLAPSQWETSIQSNAVSHWLGANLASALHILLPVTDGYICWWSRCSICLSVGGHMWQWARLSHKPVPPRLFHRLLAQPWWQAICLPSAEGCDRSWGPLKTGFPHWSDEPTILFSLRKCTKVVVIPKRLFRQANPHTSDDSSRGQQPLEGHA